MLGTSVPDESNEPPDTLNVRAAFLRFLLLGGDSQAPVHEHGVWLEGGYVTGELDLACCRIPHHVSLHCCRFAGIVLAQDARVDGVMNLQGSHLSLGLYADGLRCDGGLFLRRGFKATGEVRLLGAQIGGNLECSDGQFEVHDGIALWAERVVVQGNVFFNNGFKTTGEVRLLGAQIGGSLECRGGQFEVKDGDALSADGAVVRGSMSFGSGFKATGKVRLMGTQIGANLECSGGLFEVKDGHALLADGAVVRGNVSFNSGFKATGEVRLVCTQIGANLECIGGLFEVKEGDALSVERAVVKGAWHFTKLKAPVCVNASHMEVAVLADTVDSWAAGSALDGLRYGSLGGRAPTQGKARLAWLHKQQDAHLGSNDFRPQPWRHLQHVLREIGHAEDARQIGIAFERQLHRIGRIGQSSEGTWAPVAWTRRVVARAAHALFGWLSGYGYRPMRLIAWMALVWLVCAMSYWWLALPPRNAIGPSDPLVFQHARYAACTSDSPVVASAAAGGVPHARNWYLCADLPAEYSTFSPLAFSLDLLLPLVDLGQDKAWGALISTPKANWWEELFTVSPGHVVRWLVWFQTLFGWVASLLLVGIASGFARRSEE